jgi:hypothetical protein
MASKYFFKIDKYNIVSLQLEVQHHYPYQTVVGVSGSSMRDSTGVAIF